MNHLSNVDAIYKEFSFLEKYVKRSVIEKATVGRWCNKDINNYYPRNGTSRSIATTLFLIDELGDVICTVGVLRPVNRFLNLFEDELPHQYESIGQAFARITTEERKRICFGLEMENVVKFYVFFSKWTLSTQTLKIFKLPNGSKNALEWVEAVVDESLKEIQKL